VVNDLPTRSGGELLSTRSESDNPGAGVSDFYIVTPSRNFGRFLRDAIESVRKQVGSTAKHHVQDAMSSDNTLAVLEDYGNGVSYCSEADAGQCDAINRALRECPPDAEFIGWLNADEYYAAGALLAVADIFRRHPNVDVVYGDSVHVTERGEFMRLVAQHRFSSFVLRNYGPYMQTSSTFYRRRLLDDGVLFLDTNYRQAMDYELYLRIASSGAKFKYVKRNLSFFRVHAEQLTALNGLEFGSAERKKAAESMGFRIKPTLGRWRHRIEKVFSRAYIREVANRKQSGARTLWM
jgi:glycosyltransferase involved in cell wall biosynthesis